jgi:hypothetical protein
MKKDNIPLKNKLLKIGNPQLWGRIYNITLKDGLLKQGKLVRVNWSMKYGEVIGNCYLLENKTETKINLEDVLGIELFEKQMVNPKTADTKLREEKTLNVSTINKPKREFLSIDIIE